MKSIAMSHAVEMVALTRAAWSLRSFFTTHVLQPMNLVIDINNRAIIFVYNPIDKQSTLPVISTTCELKPVIINSLRNILYAVCLYGAYGQFDTLPLSLILWTLDYIMQSLRLTVRYILHVRTFHVCISLQVCMIYTYLNIYHSERSSHGTQYLHNVHDTW